MMIHKITPSADLKKWLKRLNTQLIEPPNQNSIKSPKLLSQRIRKCYYNALGTSVTNSPMFPPSLKSVLPRDLKQQNRKMKDKFMYILSTYSYFPILFRSPTENHVPKPFVVSKLKHDLIYFYS